jgi:hypothetical protein
MRLVTLLVGSVLVLAAAGSGMAQDPDAVCKRVNKMLSMGRTAEDIVTTSAGTISEEDIDRCKAEKPAATGDAPATNGAPEKPAE